MAEFNILGTLAEIDFAPSNEIVEIIQNVRTICSTTKFSVPLDRAFGIDARIVDAPTPRAIALLQAEIIRAIRKYEPRCKVVRVTFDGDVDGRLVPNVRVRINEE